MNDIREAMLEYARGRLAKLEPGVTFTVEDLFRDFSWRDIPIKGRLWVGNEFHDLFFSKDCDHGVLTKLGKTKEDQQIYQKRS